MRLGEVLQGSSIGGGASQGSHRPRKDNRASEEATFMTKLIQVLDALSYPQTARELSQKLGYNAKTQLHDLKKKGLVIHTGNKYIAARRNITSPHFGVSFERDENMNIVRQTVLDNFLKWLDEVLPAPEPDSPH